MVQTKNMVFGVAQLVSDLSEFMTPFPGDIVVTGDAGRRATRAQTTCVSEGRRSR